MPTRRRGGMSIRRPGEERGDSERGEFVVGFGGGWLGWWWAEAGWSGDAGDAAGGGDLQGAVGQHPEGPAAGEGLEPVVGAAQAAQVGAVGGAAAGVRDDVVVVGPADPLPAVREAAGAVPGGDEGVLGVGGLVALDRRRRVQTLLPADPPP